MAGSIQNGGGDDYTPMAEMNMVPFIDVMLVLLIISMVTTPFLEQGVNVELPVASGQNLQKQEVVETPVVLFVSRDKNLRLGDKPVTRADLPKQLVEKFKGRGTRELFVRADKEVPYGTVAEIMALVQAAGIERVGLVTQPQ
jgi:biopolymer transport protein TolR